MTLGNDIGHYMEACSRYRQALTEIVEAHDDETLYGDDLERRVLALARCALEGPVLSHGRSLNATKASRIAKCPGDNQQGGLK